ncbi:MAG: alpha-amylase [Leptospira sp.]|nr:alpha-amylase [Leptospira sp.]
MALCYLDLPEMKACDYLWTMGIWQNSPSSVAIAKSHQGLQKEFKICLPNLQSSDIIGSPYAIYDYKPNSLICDSFDQLAEFHETLRSAGKKLILDFVPNHLAIDSPWIDSIPDAFLERSKEYFNPKLTSQTQSSFFDKNHFLHSFGKYFAHGRDPYFDGWTDTIQFDFSSEETLDLHRTFLNTLSKYCDGLRCDMAMLPLSDVFERTHGKKSLPFYWEEMIRSTKDLHPDFIFIAEVYWNMESRLQEMGFDLTYDKDLYDHLKHKNSNNLIYHLNADSNYVSKSLHFLENHDEPRSNSVFFRDSIHFFALLAFLPGGLLIHEGQKEGYMKRIPVQLITAPHEEIDSAIHEFYGRAFLRIQDRNSEDLSFQEIPASIYDQPQGISIFSKLLESNSAENLKSELLIFNPNHFPVAGRIHPSQEWIDKYFPKGNFRFLDLVNNQIFSQDRKEVIEHGIYFRLEGFHSHWLVVPG